MDDIRRDKVGADKVGADDVRRKRLLHRARYRGCRELDMIVGGFAAARLAAMSEDELEQFAAILDLPEPELLDWTLHGVVPPPWARTQMPPARAQMLEALRAFARSGAVGRGRP